MLENLSLALEGVWSHKLRSFLTMLGIIIGIASIITIVSTIQGTNEQIKKNLIGSGNNVVDVVLMEDGYEKDLSYGSLPEGVSVITEETREALDELDCVEATSLYLKRSWSESTYVGKTQYSSALLGVDENYLSVMGFAVNYGRAFLEEDFTECRKVCLIDTTAARSLFNGENAVGQTVEIAGEPFTVVGVISEKASSAPVINSIEDYYMYSGYGSSTMLIPITCWSIIFRYDEPQSVAVLAASTDDMTRAGSNVADYLNSSQITSDKISYQSDDLLEQAAQLQSLSETTNKQLIWIAGISLLVGGIGVMNIMLVSVTERIREIGLKIAIGAQRSRIRKQFLTEAAVLTSLGGLLGVLFGIGLAELLSKVMGTVVAISIPACIIAVAFSMLIGIVFGLVPAVKASKLDPIVALRRE